jgi:hypothetical protein
MGKASNQSLLPPPRDLPKSQVLAIAKVAQPFLMHRRQGNYRKIGRNYKVAWGN